MSATTECLDNAIGLSTTKCECFDLNKPLDYARSDSGLYMDRLDGIDLKMVDAMKDCDPDNLWDIMVLAREEATKETKNTLMQNIAGASNMTRQPWLGWIGDTVKFNKDYDPGKTYASLSLICADIVSGYMKLTSIGTMMTQTATFEVSLFCNYQDAPLGIWDVESLADKFKVTAIEPIELIMSHPSVAYVQYWLVYTLGQGFLPKNSAVSCGCGTITPEWNARTPIFYSGPSTTAGKAIKERWAEFVMARGMAGNDLTDMPGWTTTTETNGLAAEVQFGCRIEETVCKDSLDFVGNPLAKVIATAIWFKSGEKLVEAMIATGLLSRYTMLDKERLWGKRNHYRAQHDARQAWLLEQFTRPEILNSVSDCFTCRNEEGFALAHILT